MPVSLRKHGTTQRPLQEVIATDSQYESVDITDIHLFADWHIFRRGNLYFAVDGESGSIGREDASWSTVTQYAFDQAANGAHIHFNSRDDNGTRRDHIADGKVTIDNSALVSGAGNNATTIQLDNDVDDNLFEVGATSRVVLAHFENLRLVGNRANNTAGSGIKFIDATEYSVTNCESRNWADYGYNNEVNNSGGRILFDNAWALSNSKGGLRFGSVGGAGYNRIWIHGGFYAENSGVAGLLVEDGVPFTQFDIAGIHAETNGDTAVRIRSGRNGIIRGGVIKIAGGGTGLRLDPSTSNRFDAKVMGTVFRATDAGATGIAVGGNASYLHIDSPQFGGAGSFTDEISNWSSPIITNLVLAARSRNKGTATIPSGSTSVSVNHGLAADYSIDLGGLDRVMVTPTSGLGAASNWWVSDPTSNDGSFDINVDADPTQNVDFAWWAHWNR